MFPIFPSSISLGNDQATSTGINLILEHLTMAGGRGNRNSKNKKKQQRKHGVLKGSTGGVYTLPPQPAYWPDYMNFVHEAGVGCHIGFPQHYYLPKDHVPLEKGIHIAEYYDWILDWEDIDVDELDDDTEECLELPELQIDPEDYTLSLYNYNHDEYQIAFISIMIVRCMDGIVDHMMNHYHPVSQSQPNQ
jgi:hypothetical protein